MFNCETCAYYDTDRNDQPCCGCVDGVNYEEEIEALKKVVVDDYATEYDEKIKAEAVKDFADRLLEKAISTRNYFEIKSLVQTVKKRNGG